MGEERGQPGVHRGPLDVPERAPAADAEVGAGALTVQRADDRLRPGP